jgi:adenylate cyclase
MQRVVKVKLNASNRAFLCIVIAIIVAATFSSFFLTGFLRTAQLSASDALYHERVALSEIVIISIDDKALQEIGRWPWNRTVWAQVIDKVDAAKPAVIGIDVSFFENSSLASDQALANAIQNASNIVLTLEYMAEGGVLKSIFSGVSGHINLYTDADGVTRAFPPTFSAANTNSNAFALEVLAKYLGKSASEIISENSVLQQSRLLVNFFGAPGSYSRISAADVLSANESTLSGWFNGKIVLIGATAPDLHDEQTVPISKARAMPGIEIHANIIQTVLGNTFLAYQDPASTIAAIFLLCIIAGLSVWRLKIYFAAIAVAIIAIGYVVLSVFMFDRGVIFNFVHPLLAMIITYVALVVAHYLLEERQRKWVTEIFGKYVSDSVAKEILAKTTREAIHLRGNRREITTLFADIRGFTRISEKLKPEEVVAMLNHYLTGMTDVVFANGGTVDKYIGDAIMAVWNAPLEQTEHALFAVKAALAMQAAATELAKKAHIPAVKYGIGINTGPAVVGSIGSERRLDYTVIGDSVNLASRLCGQAGPGQVLIGENTYELVKDSIDAKRLEKIKVKGKEEAVVVYEVLGLK